MNAVRRKIVSLNLAIFMILSLLPFGITTAKAADDIGYATFFQNKDDSTGTNVQYDNFLASNCNLKIYEALKKYISTNEGSVLVGFSDDAGGQQRYHFYDIIKDVFSTDGGNPGVVYGQWSDVTGGYVIYISVDQTTDGKDYILYDNLGNQVTLLDEGAFQYADEDIVVAWKANDDIIYAPGSTISISDGVDLEAIPGANYITFFVDDISSFKYYCDPDSILASGMRNPTKSGYVFAGWNSEEDGTGSWYCPGTNIQGVPHYLYAQFSTIPEEDYVIIICNTGLEDGKYAEILTIGEGNTVILPDHADNDSAIAYWVGRNEKGEIFYPAGEPVTVESGLTLEAVVVQEDSYYGVVDGNGGLTSAGSPYFATSCYITSAGNLNLYSFNDFVTFEKENLVLTGYTGQRTGHTYSFNDDIWAAMGQEAEDSNIARFTATYSETEGGYIQYMGNGAYTSAGESYYLQSGLNFSNLGENVIMENRFTPPSNQYFLGWNTAQDGSGDWYMNGDEIALAVQIVEIDAVDDVPGKIPGCLDRDVGVITIDLKTEMGRSICNLDTDRAQTDDAQPLAGEFRPDKTAFSFFDQLADRVTLSGKGVYPFQRGADVAAGQHETCNRQLLDCIGVGTGSVENCDALLGATVDGNVIGTRACTRYCEQTLGQFHLFHVLAADKDPRCLGRIVGQRK